jgi:DsbC/DsbD-like thiol-disulfide interchange protein
LTTRPIDRHNSNSAVIERSLYVFHMSSAPLDHTPPHDEFNGVQKVSLVDRPMMTIMMTRTRGSVRLTAAVYALLLTVGGALAADDVSPWDGDARSGVRLIAGSQPKAGVLRAGVEIRLKPGWHTYWRYPGDAGVPPQFDFKGSQNVKDVHVLWPTPRRIEEGGGSAIGYSGDVIFPLLIVAQDAAKPVVLRVKVDYAICEKLCVPAEARLELALSKGPTSRDADLAAAEARVPKQAALGEGSTLAVHAVRRDAGAARGRVIVDVVAPAGDPVDLFAEGPTPQWALPLPVRIEGAPPGMQRFAFDIDGLPPGASDQGALITFTAATPDRAIEVATRLD